MSIFILISSRSTSPNFYCIPIFISFQSIGASCSFLNQSFACLHKLSFTILKNLTSSYPWTSDAISNHYIQSKTSSNSFPYKSTWSSLSITHLRTLAWSTFKIQFNNLEVTLACSILTILSSGVIKSCI